MVVLLLALAFPAQGAGATRHATPGTDYRIPAGTLDDALTLFAEQSNLQLLYSHALVRSRRSPGLSGSFERDAALARLLAGHRLTAVPINANTYIVQRIAQPSPRPRPAVASAPAPLPPSSPAQPLARVMVTGTRIPRASLETSTPITVITAEDIERSGHDTLFEFLRTVPGMWGHHPVSVSTEGGSAYQPIGPAAATSLYSLGPRATLFLVDGRRVASYGLVSADLGGVFDLNGIPLSFIDRIEILRGGASAIYGADAMAGTVNIVLKKYDEGFEGSLRTGMSERGDGQMLRVSSSFGASTRRDGHVFVSASTIERRAVQGDRRAWHTANLSRFGLDDDRAPLGIYGPTGAPGPVPWPRCEDAGQNPDSPYCRFDGARDRTLQPALSGTSLYAHWQQALGADTTLHASGRFSEIAQSLQSPPLIGQLPLPLDHPDWGSTPRDQRFLSSPVYAFYELGPVRNHTRARSSDLAFGLDGSAGTWSWRAELSRSRNHVDPRIGKMLLWQRLGQVLDRYRLVNEQNDPALIDAIGADIRPSGRLTLDMLSASSEGPVFALPAGMARMVAGVELRRQRLDSRPDPLQLSGELSLAATGMAERTLHDRTAALFAELSVPLSTTLQADVAARLDHSKGFERRLSPRIGLKWKHDERLALRASAGKGYRAPSVHDARTPLYFTTGPSIVEITDPDPSLRPCTGSGNRCLLEYGTGGNPNLRPETSRSRGVGVIWAPGPSFNIALDHYRVVREHEFGVGDPAAYPLLFPEGLVRDADGVLYRANLHLTNLSRTRARGWELDANHLLRTASRGTFQLRLAAHYLEHDVRASVIAPGDAVEHAGHDVPKLTLLGRLEWAYADWSTTLDLRHFGGVYAYPAGEPCPEGHRTAGRCRNPSTALLGLGVDYAGFQRWRLSAHVANLADRQPVDYRPGQDGYNSAIDDPFGRYYTFSATYRF